jgi:hypothetical protein
MLGARGPSGLSQEKMEFIEAGLRLLNLAQVQKWSFTLEKTTDLELDLVYNRIEEYKNAYSNLQEDSDLWAEVGHLGDLLKQNHSFYEALPKGAGPAQGYFLSQNSP